MSAEREEFYAAAALHGVTDPEPTSHEFGTGTADDELTSHEMAHRYLEFALDQAYAPGTTTAPDGSIINESNESFAVVGLGYALLALLDEFKAERESRADRHDPDRRDLGERFGRKERSAA